LPPPSSVGPARLCGDQPTGSDTKIFAAYSLIDENYFRYTRAQQRVKRKIFS
jgi:hypothetical protein